MTFQVIGNIWNVEVIATGKGIRDRPRLIKAYGGTNWRKKKGFANVILENGAHIRAELHWYEAHGVGKVEIKLKEYWDL